MTRITPEELRARLYKVDEDILVFREFPKPSEETFFSVEARLHELIPDDSPFCLVVDAREIVSRPSAKVRAIAHQKIEQIKPQLLFVVGVTGGVLFRKIMLKFAFGFVVKKPHTICVTIEDGIEACRAFLAARS